GTVVPAEARVLDELRVRLLVRGRYFLASCRERALLVGRDELAHLLDQCRPRRLSVASNRKVDVGVAPVIVNVAVMKEMLGRDADRLASIRSCGAGESGHIAHFKPEVDVSSIAGPAIPPERMPRGKVLPGSVRADVHGSLKQLG